jgi:hypothetical protein
MTLVAVYGEGFLETCRTQKMMLSQKQPQIAVFAL